MSSRAAPRHRSLWLEGVDAEEPAPRVEGRQRAQIAVIGGGYTGLWSALRLKEIDPDLDVALIESDVCGGGASGRNGGFVLSWAPKAPSLIAMFGEDGARRLIELSQSAGEEVGAFADANGIDADYNQAGWIWTATSEAQLGAWRRTAEACAQLGLPVFEELSREAVAARTGSDRHLAGVFDSTAATVHPGALARGLRRVALDRGIRVFENSGVRGFTRSAPSVIETGDGRLTADRVILATNAWAAGIKELRRLLVVVSSDIVATAPIPERLHEIGWVGGEGITDSQMMIHYYRTTSDGRIVFGKGGWGLAYAGRIGRDFDRSASRAAEVERNLRRLYPNLGDQGPLADWSGPIDRSYSGLPMFGRLGAAKNIVYGVGFSGNGIGPAWIGGRILASLSMDIDDEWARLPLVGQQPRRFPPVPITFGGAHVVRSAVVRKERRENEGREPGVILDRIAGLAPAGLEDKEK